MMLAHFPSLSSPNAVSHRLLCHVRLRLGVNRANRHWTKGMSRGFIRVYFLGGAGSGQHAQLAGASQRLGAVTRLKLGVDVAGVGFDGPHRDVEVGGDLAVGSARSQKLEDLSLPLRKGFDQGSRGSRPLLAPLGPRRDRCLVTDRAARPRVQLGIRLMAI